MPASSQQSPTSGMRRTGRAQSGQRTRMLVEPRPVQLRHRVDRRGIDRQRPELGARADDGEAPAFARVEGQGEAPVALARDAPVAHVGEPVVHAPLHVAGQPRDALVGGAGQRPDLGGAQEPLVRDAEDQLLATPPAGGVAMAVRGAREEQAALLQQAGDRRGGVRHRRPRERAQAIEVAPFRIHRRDDGKAVPAAELEVLEAAARRDVDDPGAFLGGDVLPGDHAVLDAPLDGQVVERPGVAQAHELGALDGAPRPAERRVAPGETGGDVVDRARVLALGVVELGVNGQRHVGRQRPRRRRPHEQRGGRADPRSGSATVTDSWVSSA